LDDDTRREWLYAGQLFVLSPTRASLALVELAKELIAEAFGGRDPEHAQFEMEVEEYAALLSVLKPKFIHDPRAKQCLQGILRETGCNLEKTYFDVPRMRTATSENYLTSGIAYAFHPHRDTWYSAPTCQLNWWLPIDALAPDDGLAFHPAHFERAIANSSHLYDYEEWNRTSRFNAAEQIGVDTRVQPHAEQALDLSDELRLVTGPAVLQLFSGAQLHASVPNTSGRTRYSIDFRTVHRGDAEAGIGAKNRDSRCSGSSIGDFLRCSDLAHLPDETIRRQRAGLGR
jgi:hypothetical protein